MTSPNPEPSQPEPTADPNRPTDSDQAALFDAVAAEHAAIYGYGIVSAHIYPDENELVSRVLAEHRDRRCCPGHGHAAAEAPVVAVTVGGGVVAGGDVAGGEVAGGAVAGGAVAVGAVGAGPAPTGADPPPELGLAPDAELAEGAAPDEPALAA